MKGKDPLHRQVVLEVVSQNRSAVATAEPARRGGCRRAGMSNSIEAPRHSEATTTFTKRVLGVFVLAIVISSAPSALAVKGG
jgi:hypothetical protein